MNARSQRVWLLLLATGGIAALGWGCTSGPSEDASHSPAKCDTTVVLHAEGPKPDPVHARQGHRICWSNRTDTTYWLVFANSPSKVEGGPETLTVRGKGMASLVVHPQKQKAGYGYGIRTPLSPGTVDADTTVEAEPQVIVE